MGGRVVEGTGLENRQGGNSFVGSNPTPSAIMLGEDDSKGLLAICYVRRGCVLRVSKFA